MQGQEVKEVKVFTYPNFKATVTIPVLSEAERARRMKVIHKAAEAVLKTV